MNNLKLVHLLFFIFVLYFICNSQGQLRVNTMPSNSINKMEGNAVLNQPIEIWGSATGGNPPYNWQLFVDDELIQSGTTYDGHFIGISYSFHTLGKRKVKLIVNGVNSEASIRVHLEPIDLIKINMLIEKGLLYLYKTCIFDGTDRIYWNSSTGDNYKFAGTSSSILAFEEFGHLASNDFDLDPYAELVKKGLKWILTTYSGQKQISNHPDGFHGTPVSDSFTALGGSGTMQTGLLKGSYLFNQTSSDMYANAFGLLAVIMSKNTAYEAQNNIIEGGYFNGWSYYNFILDALDLLYWSQGDSDNRGGWHYELTQNSGGGYDGSCQQWPILVFKAAKDRWGINQPTWIKENAEYAYINVLQSTTGGCAYDDYGSSVNCGKTGGMLAGFAWLDKLYSANDQNVADALDYIKIYYNDWSNVMEVNGGWAGNLYHMYAIKKGLQLQNIKKIDNKDWYDHMVAWLSGELIGDLPTGFTMTGHSNNNAFGSYPDGGWLDNCWINEYPIGTAHALLILIQAVTVLPPVAIIDVVPNQPDSTSFRLNGSHSFHLDLTSSIIEWNWDFDNDGLFDDATGQRPIHPGFHNLGPYQIGLEVVDDNNPALTSTDEITVNITSGDHPPVAIPIPDSLLPCYAGRVNEQIHIYGQQSKDPDGTDISDYSWDTDGNGDIGNMITPDGYIAFDDIYNGQVGLKVKSNNLFSTQEYVDIFVSDYDISVMEVKASPVYMGTSKVDLYVKFFNDPQSSKDFENVLVRFFDENPFLTGNRIGGDYFVNLPIGATVNFTVTLDIDVDIHKAYIYLDADQRYEEWNEVNNYLPVDIIKFGLEDSLTICENSEAINFKLLLNDFSEGYDLSIIAIPDSPPNGYCNILNDTIVEYLPEIGYFGNDHFTYVIEIFNSGNGDLVGYDTTDVYVTINPIPQIFQSEDIIVCIYDSILVHAGNPGSLYNWREHDGDTSWPLSFNGQSFWVKTTGVGFDMRVFSVEVTNLYNCQNTDTIIIIFDASVCPPGINEIIEELKVNIYPNPTSGVFYIELKNFQFSDKVETQIYNIYGDLIDNKPNRKSEFMDGSIIIRIDISDKKNGIYFVNIKSNSKNKLYKILLNKL